MGMIFAALNQQGLLLQRNRRGLRGMHSAVI